MKNLNKKKRVIILIVYCIFIASIIVLADLGKLPLKLLWRIPHYDWIAHFLLYAIFYIILDVAVMGKRISIFRRSISLAFLLISLLIIGEEISQLLFSSRTFSLIDLLMGLLGIFSAELIKRRFARILRNRSEGC
ncbi:MAG: hypothetical protein GY756_24095 [bacterium]|nr:hypothetical protein [bacterium]